MIKKIIDKLQGLLKVPFVRFALVGFLGMVVNLLIFYILVDVLKLWVIITPLAALLNRITGTHPDPEKVWPSIVNVCTFLLVGVQNYILHHKWTFRETTTGEKLSFLSWLKFNLSTSIGLGISLVVMNLVLYLFAIPLMVIAQGCGVFAGTVLNYLASKYLIFNKKKNRRQPANPDSDTL